MKDRIKWRQREYKQDSTKGGAILAPVTYKRDAMIQVWMDSRKLATLYLWLTKIGIKPKFVSEIINEAVDIITNNAIESGMIEGVDTTTQAREILSIFQIDLNPSDRGKKNLLHNYMLDDNRSSSVKTGRLKGPDPEVLKLIEEERKLAELSKEREKKDKEQIEALKNM